MTVGFAGLGLMGLPMAERMLGAGPLRVFNRSSGPRERLAAIGAHCFDDPNAFLAGCDTVLLMLADDTAVDEVLGRGRLGLPGRLGGKLIINMGTHSPAWSRALAGEIEEAGGRFVEAPVSGSAGAAASGALVAMLAGRPQDVAFARKLLAPMCRGIVVAGEVPKALACKLAVNLYLIASVAALAEAYELATRSGVDPAIFGEVIGRGPLGSDVARGKLGKILSNDFTAEASIRDVCRNAALVAAASEERGLTDGLLALARKRFEVVQAAGGSELDMAAVSTAFREEEG